MIMQFPSVLKRSFLWAANPILPTAESLVKVRIHRAKGKLQELLEDLRKSGEI